MFARLLQACGQVQHIVFAQPVGGDHGCYLGLALGQCAGFIHDQRVDLLHPLQGLCRFDEHACARPLADSDHNRHRRGQPECAGTGNDDNGHRRDKRIGECGLGAPHRPASKGRDGDGQHRWNEISRDRLGADDERAGAIDGAANDLVPHHLWRGHGFTRDHRLVRSAFAVQHRASTGTPSPGRTRNRSPTLTASTGISSSSPPSRRRLALFGARLNKARIAPPVWSRARNSSTWPSRTSTVMTAAAS